MGPGESGQSHYYPHGIPVRGTRGGVPPYALVNVRPGRQMKELAARAKAALPATMDWTASLPPVRNQGSTPLCWDFAGIGAFEAAEILTRSLAPASVDYSERMIGDYYPNAGGSLNMVASYLLTYGAVKEIDKPWTETQSAWTPNIPADRLVNSWCYLGNLNTAADIATLKAAVLQQPVGVALKTAALDAWGDWSHQVAPASVEAATTDTDHVVVLVGWDDGKPQSGGGVGAWKVRNSWGSGWGDNGYFWIGYTAAAIGSWAGFYPPAASESYPTAMVPLILDHGWDGGIWGWSNWHDVYMINQFTIPSSVNTNAVLQSIDFAAPDSDLSYEVRVYSSFNHVTPSGLLASKSGQLSEAGCYSIRLDQPLAVEPLSTVYLWLHFHTAHADAYLVPIGQWGVDLPQRCYISSNETGATWYDVNTSAHGQIVLRGRVVNGPNQVGTVWNAYE